MEHCVRIMVRIVRVRGRVRVRASVRVRVTPIPLNVLCSLRVPRTLTIYLTLTVPIRRAALVNPDPVSNPNN